VIAEETLGINIRGPKAQELLSQYGPITPNDTLWNIATNVRTDPSLTIYQVMQSLYLSNPQAFAQENINYLVEGQILRIPPVKIMRAINDNSAKVKAETDQKRWISKETKQLASKVYPSAEQSVNKTDLDKAKTEINEQLLSFGESQKLQLDMIQSDLSDSIVDGMQTLLNENKDLRSRFITVVNKLAILEDNDVRYEKEKGQLNETIKRQQKEIDLLKEEKQKEILKNEQAELKRQSIIFSPIYTALLMTIPAILILALSFLFYTRRNRTQLNDREFDTTEMEKSSVDQLVSEDEHDQDNPFDIKLSLDDEELLDDDLSLNEEPSIDSVATDNDELLSSESSQLDDDLDDLDDFDDIDDIILDDDVLPVSENDQGSLDSLLLGLEDDDKPKSLDDSSEDLNVGELEQNDLDSLLGDLDSLEDESVDIKDDFSPITDDLDALLAENLIDDLSADVTNPDDIDALLAENLIDDLSADVTEPDDIDALLDENLTDDLPVDVGVTDLDTEEVVDVHVNEPFDEDELDIDELISKVSDEELSDDIGDDLLADIESVNKSDDKVINTIDDETTEAISADFDESTLAQLLNDEKEEADLSPDFTDKKVLEDLLSDAYISDDVPDASEIEDIKKLDNLDFDELLANIEEESEVSTKVDILEIENDNNTKDVTHIAEQDNESTKDFVSVDSLLSDSLDTNIVEENYDKDNIDVGLDDFPEFTADVDVDVDIDELGLAEKLDLAKVYLEMGDLDNAEVILADIVNLGDEQQQVDAQKLLDEINS
jgi:pilus assembly protein FimV